MKPIPSLSRAALLLAATLTSLPAAQAAPVLYEQAPLQTAGALAIGSDGQAPLLSETFSFTGVGTMLSWWGTAGEGFDLSLRAGAGSAVSFSQPRVDFAPAGFTVVVDVDGDQQDDTVDVYRYSIDLAALPGGTYTLSIRETTTDALGSSWFWLHGAPGDGLSQSGLDDLQAGPETNRFDLSLRVQGERGGSVPEPAGLGLAVAALVACGCLRRRVRSVASRGAARP